MAIKHSILYDPPEIEYLDGHPYPKVSPKRTHALVQKALLRILDDCARDRGEVGPEWRFDLGAVDITYTEFVPDVAFVSFERLDTLTDEEAEEPPFAPDIAVEIRSPSDKPAFIRRKIERYLETGSTLVLDVNPATHTIHAYTAQGMRKYKSGEMFAHSVVPWLTFDVEDIFPKPRRR